ncbi:MAG: glycosyltransferase family 87 protein [Zavarzinella sp.]
MIRRWDRYLQPRLRWGLAIAAIFWIVWLITCFAGHGNRDANGQVIGTDHAAFYTAGHLLATNHGATLYDFPDLTEFRQKQQQLLQVPQFLDPIRNPPFYAVCYRTTCGLPYLASLLIWTGIGFTCLLLALRLLEMPTSSVPWVLSFAPVLATVTFGQNTFLSLVIFALGYQCYRRSLPTWAGVAFGLLLYKPQLLAGVFFWLLFTWRKNFRVGIGIAFITILLCCISYFWLRIETESWLRHFPQIAQYNKFEYYNVHSIRGFVALLLGKSPYLESTCNVVGLLIGATMIFLVVRRFPHHFPIQFATIVLATLWASPHTMIYSWTLAIIPAGLLWYHVPNLRPTWRVLFAIAWWTFWLSTPLTLFQQRTLGVAVQISTPILAWCTTMVGIALWKESWNQDSNWINR